jgi:hypothetical protein
MTDTTDLVARLRDQWDMIQLGEDAYEAADAIERLTKERDEARSRFNDIDLCRMAQAPCNALLDAETRIAELTRERDEALALLCKWDALIKHQYTGSREAMSDMTRVAQETAASLRIEGADT